MSSYGDEQVPHPYALRFTPRARSDIETARSYLSETADEEIADEWQTGLFDVVASLATAPRRCPIAAENSRFRQEVRQLLYRRRTGAVAYRILFTISEDLEDAPIVRILHVRHSAARPVTRKEAREMETET